MIPLHLVVVSKEKRAKNDSDSGTSSSPVLLTDFKNAKKIWLPVLVVLMKRYPEEVVRSCAAGKCF